MQNIDMFQNALLAYGLQQEDIFQTVDLWEKRNIAAVTKTIYALARVVSVGRRIKANDRTRGANL